MNIKDLFETAENGTLTYEQFETLAKDGGAKFADLSEGKYVSKSKYDADIKAKDGEIATRDEQIETLNGTITTRDDDLANLQKQLEEAGQDATKLSELNAQFSGLQEKYDSDIKAYQTKMQQQAYEFAVKEFANTKKFSSQAAKRDFTQAMINRQLQMEGGKLIGGEDFCNMYAEENDDAFYKEPEVVVVEKPIEEPKEEKPTAVPEIVAPASGPVPDNNDSGFHFNFTGVRARN